MPKILLIDDDTTIRVLLQGFLEDLGYEVVGALDGQEGMELCHREQPDLIVTDILMPKKDGIEVIGEVKKAYPEIKIIAISGGGHLADFTILETARDLGADHAMGKPFELAQFVEIVKELVPIGG